MRSRNWSSLRRKRASDALMRLILDLRVVALTIKAQSIVVILSSLRLHAVKCICKDPFLWPSLR